MSGREANGFARLHPFNFYANLVVILSVLFFFSFLSWLDGTERLVGEKVAACIVHGAHKSQPFFRRARRGSNGGGFG